MECFNTAINYRRHIRAIKARITTNTPKCHTSPPWINYLRFQQHQKINRSIKPHTTRMRCSISIDGCSAHITKHPQQFWGSYVYPFWFLRYVQSQRLFLPRNSWPPFTDRPIKCCVNPRIKWCWKKLDIPRIRNDVVCRQIKQGKWPLYYRGCNQQLVAKRKSQKGQMWWAHYVPKKQNIIHHTNYHRTNQKTTTPEIINPTQRKHQHQIKTIYCPKNHRHATKHTHHRRGNQKKRRPPRWTTIDLQICQYKKWYKSRRKSHSPRMWHILWMRTICAP
jgi:hypothetical protein